MFVLLDNGTSNTPQLLSIATNYIDIFFFDRWYFLDLFVIYLSFYLGYKIANFIFHGKTFSKLALDEIAECQQSFYLSLIMISIMLAMVFGYAIQFDVEFFSGYKQFDVIFLGTLSTITMLTIFFYIFFSSNPKSIFLLGVFIVCASILLGLGSRNVSLNGLLALVGFVVWRRPQLIRDIKLYIVLLMIPVFLLVIGIWRTGYEFNFEMLLSHLFAEGLFVLASASCYFQNVELRPILEFPYSLLAGVVNFIPSLIFPEKFHLIAQITANNDEYSPYGASSILVNMYSNFGYLYPIFLLLLAMLVTWLYMRAKSSYLFLACYLSVFPLLMFQIFNQPLYALVKLFVYNGFILPITIVFILYVIRINSQSK